MVDFTEHFTYACRHLSHGPWYGGP
jgi:hypothetical protein